MNPGAFVSSIEIQDLPLWEKMEARRALFSFDLEICARCNNDCRYCYINLPAGDADARVRGLSVAEISNIADQTVRLGATPYFCAVAHMPGRRC